MAAMTEMASEDSVGPRRRDGDPTILWVSGEHDVSTVEHLAGLLASAIAQDDADLIVDLSGASFIGSATIDVLLRGQSFLLSRGRRLAIRAPSPAARRLIEVCGLAAMIEPDDSPLNDDLSLAPS